MSQISSGNAVVDARLAELLRDGVELSLLSVRFRVQFRFVGEVAQEARGNAVAFSGDAELSHPFGFTAPLRAVIDGDGRHELRFELPALQPLLDEHVRPRLGDASKLYDSLVRPYLSAFTRCAVLLASHAGADGTLGDIVAGANFYAAARLADHEPTRSVCVAFPHAGLDARPLALHLACTSGPGLGFVLAGDAEPGVELGTPALALDRLTLRVDEKTGTPLASGRAAFTLRVGGETLEFAGPIQGAGGRATLSGALDAPQGAWKDPLGGRGVTLLGVSAQLEALPHAPHIGVRLRGGLQIAGVSLPADVALRFDPARPERAALQLVSNQGLRLPRLLAALVDATHVAADLVDVMLDDLALTISRVDGEVAGQTHAAGVALRGELELWGFRARLEGLLDYTRGGYLHGSLSPLRFPDSGWLLELAGAPERGPEVRIDFSDARKAAHVQGALKLVGRYNHGFELAVDEDSLKIALSRTKLGIYTGGALELRKTRATLTTGAAFHARVDVPLGVTRLELDLDVDASYRAEGDAQRIRQDITFSFDACGERLSLRTQAGELRFEEVESLANYFVRQSEAIGQSIAAALRSASLAAIVWLQQHLPDRRQVARALREVGAACDAAAEGLRQAYDLSAEQCGTLLREAAYTGQQIAGTLQRVYELTEAQVAALLPAIGLSARQIATALHEAFDWSAKKTAEYCDEVLDLGDEATKSALEAARYSKKEIEGAMESVFDWGEDMWDAFTGLL